MHLITIQNNLNHREGQKECIEAALSGRDVFCLMPTGGGKSVVYQVPVTHTHRYYLLFTVCPLFCTAYCLPAQHHIWSDLIWSDQMSVPWTQLAISRFLLPPPLHCHYHYHYHCLHPYLYPHLYLYLCIILPALTLLNIRLSISPVACMVFSWSVSYLQSSDLTHPRSSRCSHCHRY